MCILWLRWFLRRLVPGVRRLRNHVYKERMTPIVYWIAFRRSTVKIKSGAELDRNDSWRWSWYSHVRLPLHPLKRQSEPEIKTRSIHVPHELINLIIEGGLFPNAQIYFIVLFPAFGIVLPAPALFLRYWRTIPERHYHNNCPSYSCSAYSRIVSETPDSHNTPAG